MLINCRSGEVLSQGEKHSLGAIERRIKGERACLGAEEARKESMPFVLVLGNFIELLQRPALRSFFNHASARSRILLFYFRRRFLHLPGEIYIGFIKPFPDRLHMALH